MLRLRWGIFLGIGFLSLSSITQGAELKLSPTDRVLIVVPHPDDEVLCCGGIIQAAVEAHLPIQVVVLTYGDNNAWAFTLYHHFPVFRPKTMRAMGELRRRETLAATDVLGLPPSAILFLGYPDFGTLHLWEEYWACDQAYTSRMTNVQAVPYPTAYRPGAPYKGEEILRDLTAIIKDFRPSKIFIPQPADRQPDHQALSLFARLALQNLASDVAPDVYSYLIHFPKWPPQRGLQKLLPLDPPAPLVDSTHWLTFPLTAIQVDKKYEAVKKHRTQWAYSSRFLTSFVRGNELFDDSPIDSAEWNVGVATGSDCRGR